MMMFMGFPVDLSACLMRFLQNPKCHAWLLRQPACKNAQVNPTGGPLRGGSRSLDSDPASNIRRMGSFSSYLKGGLPVWPNSCLSLSSASGSELLRSPPRSTVGSLKKWLTMWPPGYGDLVLIPEALTLYRCPSPPGRQYFQAGLRSQNHPLPTCISPPGQYRKPPAETSLLPIDCLKPECSATRRALRVFSCQAGPARMTLCCFLSTKA